MPLELYRQMDDVHNIGSFLCLREAIRIMTNQEYRRIPVLVEDTTEEEHSSRSMSKGSIVMVTSLASKGGNLGTSAYIAAKHATEGLIKTAGKLLPPILKLENSITFRQLWRMLDRVFESTAWPPPMSLHP